MERGKDAQSSGIDGYLFRLIATFEAAAMQQLGKIANPVTGDVEVDLEGATDAIEMLAAIQRKTEGNLNEDEKRLLEHVLFQLRMNYVDVAKERSSSEGEAGAAPGADDGAAPSADGGTAPGADDGAAGTPARGEEKGR